MILISSFGSAITFPHFLHVSVLSGSYMGINALTFSSEVAFSISSLLASILFQKSQLGHFILSFVFMFLVFLLFRGLVFLLWLS